MTPGERDCLSSGQTRSLASVQPRRPGMALRGLGPQGMVGREGAPTSLQPEGKATHLGGG